MAVLKAKTESVDFDLGRLPEVGMGGSERRYLTLLDTGELEDCISSNRQ